MRLRFRQAGRRLRLALIVCAAGAAVLCRSTGESPAADKARDLPDDGTAAGRTLDEWATDVDSPNRIVRLRAVKMLGVFGADAVPALTAALANPDDGVKYWAASALGDVGPSAAPAAPRLRKIVGQDRPALEISAAYALCRIGRLDEGMPILIAGVKQPDKAIACCAADFLARIGPPARAALRALKTATDSRDTHIARASREALRRIDREGVSDDAQ